MHGTCQKDSLSLLLGRPLYSSRNSRAFLTCDFTGSCGGEAAHKLSGRRALLHQRKRLRACCCQARTVLLRRGFVLLSFRWLASAEKALKPSRAATTAWAWADFCAFPAVPSWTMSLKRAASTSRHGTLLQGKHAEALAVLKTQFPIPHPRRMPDEQRATQT